MSGPFVAGQKLTAAALNAALAACYPNGNVSSFSSGLLSSISGPAFLTALGIGTPGAPNGIATLNGAGQVPASQLPPGVAAAVSYQGTWNASTNNPLLTSGSGTQGAAYQVSVAGPTNLDGIGVWNVGEWLTFTGSHWVKIGRTNPVTSVAGRTGDVVLSSADLSDGVTGTGNIVKQTGAALTNAALTNPTVTTQSPGDNSTKAASTAFVAAAIAPLQPPTVSPVRQTVCGGPVQTSGWPGAPSFLPATTAALAITSQNVSSSYPLCATAANGYGINGPVDSYGMSTANLTWNSLAANATSFLYVSIASGVLTTGSTTLAPIYQWGGAPSTTNGQFTFNVSEMRGYMGNGTTAVQANIVFVGEVVTNNTTVTSAIAYCYNGRSQQAQVALATVSGTVNILHALGLPPGSAELYLVNTSADGGWQPGTILRGANINAGSYAVSATQGNILGTHNFQWAINGAGVLILNTSGVSYTINNSDWNYYFVFRRGWGGA